METLSYNIGFNISTKGQDPRKSTIMILLWYGLWYGFYCNVTFKYMITIYCIVTLQLDDMDEKSQNPLNNLNTINQTVTIPSWNGKSNTVDDFMQNGH